MNLRDELRDIVTRKGKSGRIPELLEAELDDLQRLVNTKIIEAHNAALEQLPISGIIEMGGARRDVVMADEVYAAININNSILEIRKK
jgi:hypothetical protein